MQLEHMDSGGPAALTSAPSASPSIKLAPTYAQFSTGQNGGGIAPASAPHTGGNVAGLSAADNASLNALYAPLPKKKSGGVDKMDVGGMPMSMADPWFERREASSGFLNSATSGRTDRLPINVAADSYVIPADVVSGLGQGNSLAGARILNEALKTGPYGTQLGGVHEAKGNIPRPPAEFREKDAKGGTPHHMPIIAAGGEFVVPPEAVARVGGGDANKGHKLLHEMVKRIRHHTLKRIKQLPNPKK